MSGAGREDGRAMTDPSGGGRRLWYGVVAVLLAATLLFWSLRGVEWARVWQAIAHAHWEYLAGSMLVACVSFFLRSLRWRILLNTNYRFGVGTVFMANMAGYLGNTFLPARAGEFVRSYLISSRSTLSKMYVLTTALSERVVDAMVLVRASSVALAGVAAKPAWLGQISHASALAAGAGLAAIAIVPHTGNLVERILRRLPLPERWQVRLGDLAAQVLGGLRTFHNVGRLGGFGLATGAIWTLDCLSVMVGASSADIRARHQVEVSQ